MKLLIFKSKALSIDPFGFGINYKSKSLLIIIDQREQRSPLTIFDIKTAMRSVWIDYRTVFLQMIYDCNVVCYGTETALKWTTA